MLSQCIREIDVSHGSGLKKCEVRDVNGAPAVVVDGEPIPPMTFLVRCYYDRDYIAKYVRTGHRICLYEVRETWGIDEAAYLAISFSGCPAMMFYNNICKELRI